MHFISQRDSQRLKLCLCQYWSFLNKHSLGETFKLRLFKPKGFIFKHFEFFSSHFQIFSSILNKHSLGETSKWEYSSQKVSFCRLIYFKIGNSLNIRSGYEYKHENRLSEPKLFLREKVFHLPYDFTLLSHFSREPLLSPSLRTFI